MPILTLYFKKNKLGEYRLEKGRSLTIGRKESNDICIENLAVSGHHAKIEASADDFKLTDLKSKNGSFVNNVSVTTCRLRHGDSITIGKHRLLFTYGDEEKIPEDVPEKLEPSPSMATKERSTGHESEVPKKTAAESEKKGPAGILTYLSGGEGQIRLTKKITKLGKNPTSDIVLGGLLIGPTAAAISKNPKGFSLSYVSGLAKPKVNDEAVKEWVNLAEGDVIELGPVKFQFSMEK